MQCKNCKGYKDYSKEIGFPAFGCEGVSMKMKRENKNLLNMIERKYMTGKIKCPYFNSKMSKFNRITINT